MRGAHKAKEMKRRASQRRAAHKTRLAALTLKAEAVEAGRGKTKVRSKGSAKLTSRASKRGKRAE
jgi:hypothetical protein